MFGVADWNRGRRRSRRAVRDRWSQPHTHATEAGRHPAMPIRDFVPFPRRDRAVLHRPRQNHSGRLGRAFQGARQIIVAIQRSSDVDEPDLLMSMTSVFL